MHLAQVLYRGKRGHLFVSNKEATHHVVSVVRNRPEAQREESTRPEWSLVMPHPKATFSLSQSHLRGPTEASLPPPPPPLPRSRRPISRASRPGPAILRVQRAAARRTRQVRTPESHTLPRAAACQTTQVSTFHAAVHLLLAVALSDDVSSRGGRGGACGPRLIALGLGSDRWSVGRGEIQGAPSPALQGV